MVADATREGQKRKLTPQVVTLLFSEKRAGLLELGSQAHANVGEQGVLHGGVACGSKSLEQSLTTAELVCDESGLPLDFGFFSAAVLEARTSVLGV